MDDIKIHLILWMHTAVHGEKHKSSPINNSVQIMSEYYQSNKNE